MNEFAKKILFIGFVLAAVPVVILFAACSAETIEKSPLPTREIADGVGRTVILPERVSRAVSLAPNLTEIVFAVGAGDRLVGRTSYCNYPAEARAVKSVGDTLNPNIESIIALKPDVVLVSTASQLESFTRTLETRNIAVFVTDPTSLDDVYQSIETIGEIFGNSAKAKFVLAELKERAAAVEEKTRDAEKMRVFVQLDKSLYTIGKDSFLTVLVEKAGGISLTKDVATAYPKISRETALALRPDAIILSDSDDNREPNEVFADSPAVKNGRVYRINADIMSRPGPRLVEALEEMAKALHPELFK